MAKYRHFQSSAARIAAQEMTIRVCPITGGGPTRMTRKTFKRMCAAWRDKSNKHCAGGSWGISGEATQSKYCPCDWGLKDCTTNGSLFSVWRLGIFFGGDTRTVAGDVANIMRKWCEDVGVIASRGW